MHASLQSVCKGMRGKVTIYKRGQRSGCIQTSGLYYLQTRLVKTYNIFGKLCGLGNAGTPEYLQTYQI